jgi:predicted nucleic acid-binding Zn ribbon protein
MSFQSLEEILQRLQQDPNWDSVSQFRQVLQHWKTVVSPKIFLYTRPLAVNRQVLSVATSSSAWAQNLSLQRYSLLKKINPLLTEPLQDIRFAPAKWHQPHPNAVESFPESDFADHPSYIAENQDNFISSTLPPDVDLKTGFNHWANGIEKRAQLLPLCPRCHAPTPAGELKRWSVCAYCFVNK